MKNLLYKKITNSSHVIKTGYFTGRLNLWFRFSIHIFRPELRNKAVLWWVSYVVVLVTPASVTKLTRLPEDGLSSFLVHFNINSATNSKNVQEKISEKKHRKIYNKCHEYWVPLIFVPFTFYSIFSKVYYNLYNCPL